MKRVFSIIPPLLVGAVGGLIVGILLPDEQREKLSRQLESVLGEMVERVPDD